jgi:3-oxoacyl-[acyl-carrier protein] reductase
MPAEHVESQTFCTITVFTILISVTRQVSWEEFDRTLNLNLRASFILTKELIAPMREQRWGRIVFVSSIAAQGGGINGPHYAASKGGLTGLMKNLSTRLAEYNISVNHYLFIG